MASPSIDFVDLEQARSIVGGTAVVIDVMRAFTVAAWALHLGARELVLVDGIEEAVTLAAAMPGCLLLKDGAPDERFDLYNSPVDLLSVELADRVIVQRTRAGTRSAVAARNATAVLCASFVCASATAARVRSLGDGHVTFVVSGGLDAEEDLACAELIADLVRGGTGDPAAAAARADRSRAASKLRSGLANGDPGINPDDIGACLDVDRFGFPMEATDHGTHLVLRKG